MIEGIASGSNFAAAAAAIDFTSTQRVPGSQAGAGIGAVLRSWEPVGVEEEHQVEAVLEGLSAHTKTAERRNARARTTKKRYFFFFFFFFFFLLLLFLLHHPSSCRRLFILSFFSSSIPPRTPPPPSSPTSPTPPFGWLRGRFRRMQRSATVFRSFGVGRFRYRIESSPQTFEEKNASLPYDVSRETVKTKRKRMIVLHFDENGAVSA